jgi:hypothetical protein
VALEVTVVLGKESAEQDSNAMATDKSRIVIQKSTATVGTTGSTKQTGPHWPSGWTSKRFGVLYPENRGKIATDSTGLIPKLWKETLLLSETVL